MKAGYRLVDGVIYRNGEPQFGGLNLYTEEMSLVTAMINELNAQDDYSVALFGLVIERLNEYEHEYWSNDVGANYFVDLVQQLEIFLKNRQIANAHLIAAAPDLLEACMAFVTAHEKSHQLEKTDVALRMCKKAIDKAKGKE